MDIWKLIVLLSINCVNVPLFTQWWISIAGCLTVDISWFVSDCWCVSFCIIDQHWIGTVFITSHTELGCWISTLNRSDSEKHKCYHQETLSAETDPLLCFWYCWSAWVLVTQQWHIVWSTWRIKDTTGFRWICFVLRCSVAMRWIGYMDSNGLMMMGMISKICMGWQDMKNVYWASMWRKVLKWGLGPIESYFILSALFKYIPRGPGLQERTEGQS